MTKAREGLEDELEEVVEVVDVVVDCCLVCKHNYQKKAGSKKMSTQKNQRFLEFSRGLKYKNV